jgi:hypothetical protein
MLTSPRSAPNDQLIQFILRKALLFQGGEVHKYIILNCQYKYNETYL